MKICQIGTYWEWSGYTDVVVAIRMTPSIFAYRQQVQRAESDVFCVSPLLLSGLWSVLASLFSRWGTVVGSGVGLVLQLFSCFTGDESAMELWLLLSSEREKTGRKLNSRSCLVFLGGSTLCSVSSQRRV